MVARVLITTALEDTWPKDGAPILFLGEWCKLYDRKHVWEKLNYEVVPYHWNDRNKLYDDYRYLRFIYEIYLKKLSCVLNENHQVNYSLRYWRILIGPWVAYFIQIIYDRWAMLSRVLDADNQAEFVSVEFDSQRRSSLDMKDFVTSLESDRWNQMLYQDIAHLLGFKIRNSGFTLSEDTAVSAPSFKKKISLLRAMLLNSVSKILFPHNGYFAVTTYLNTSDSLKLQIKSRLFFGFWQREFRNPVRKKTNRSEYHQSGSGYKDSFTSMLEKLILLYMPQSYIENYSDNEKLANRRYPESVKAIFDASSWNSDDIFKIWAAKQACSGAKLLVAQHGGNYGMGLWNFSEEHQLKIADYFINWGWGTSSNMWPVGMIKRPPRQKRRKKSNDILMIGFSIPRYSYQMLAIPVSANQWGVHFSEQTEFVKHLKEEHQKNILVRLGVNDYQLSQRKRWLDQFQDIKFDNRKNVYQSMLASRLVIGTYNATSFLESMYLDIPTVTFWNPLYWELRDSAEVYFDKLRRVGLFHDTPKQAANHVNGVIDRIEDWWLSSDVRDARQFFMYKFAKTADLSKDLSEKLLAL